MLLYILMLIGFVNLIFKISGTIVAFKKKWWLGVLTLIVPFFSEVIIICKYVLKIDILKNIK